MNAIDALNEYKRKGEQVDEELYHLVVSEIERLREQQKQLMSDYLKDLDVLSEHAMFISKLRREKGKLREALEFYGDNSNYLIEWSDKCDEYMPSVADNDGGHIARQALAGESNEN